MYTASPLPIVVVDTNIFIGACLGVGAPNRVIAAALENQFMPVMGVALFNEYEAVLGREALFRESRLSANERSELLDIFLAKCLWTRVYYGWRPNLRDETDNHLIELAIAAGASLTRVHQTAGGDGASRQGASTPAHRVLAVRNERVSQVQGSGLATRRDHGTRRAA